MNVYQKSQIVGEQFKLYFINIGSSYVPFTTYASDFILAEIEGSAGVIKTAKDAWNNWKTDYKWATEIIMTINFLAWFHYDVDVNLSLSELYSELYYKYMDLYYEQFEGNSEATEYFFEMTD